MEIADNFRVSTSIGDTWKVLLDIEGIAPCLPGAQLQEIDGDEYRGVVKVKVGPITAQYKGTATLAEVDEAAHRIVIDAAGRDTRGQGNAKAKIVVTMNDDGGGTRVDVVTDLSITGKVAQFGRGVLDDVSSKLLRQFVENLERDVLVDRRWRGPAETEPDIDRRSRSRRAGRIAGDRRRRAQRSASGNGSSSGLVVGPRRIESREVEPIDLLDMAGESAARRLVPLGDRRARAVRGLARSCAGREAPRPGAADPLASNPCSIAAVRSGRSGARHRPRALAVRLRDRRPGAQPAPGPRAAA